MFIIILGIFILLVTQGFILLEEEMLIILAGIFWVDAAGGFIKELLYSELEHKGTVIKNSYLNFLVSKKNVIIFLLNTHKNRLKLNKEFIKPLKLYYIHKIISVNINMFVIYSIIFKKYERKVDLMRQLLTVQAEIFISDLDLVLEQVDRNVIDLKPYSLGLVK